MIKLTLLLVLLSGCSFLGGLTGGSGGAEVVEAGEVTVNNGLDFWYWIIIGMFIPSPIDIIKDCIRGWRS